jgi:hypothetical protein
MDDRVMTGKTDTWQNKSVVFWAMEGDMDKYGGFVRREEVKGRIIGSGVVALPRVLLLVAWLIGQLRGRRWTNATNFRPEQTQPPKIFLAVQLASDLRVFLDFILP